MDRNPSKHKEYRKLSAPVARNFCVRNRLTYSHQVTSRCSIFPPMVQVDVFWAYGFGGSLAVAAAKPLRSVQTPLGSTYFVYTLLFLSLIWAPTGMLLLLRHPSWETMQAASSITAIPPFLVLGFGITNITQGMLGFWVGHRLTMQQRFGLAHLNWLAGYLGMFFILLYGWDGFGYDRFLYDRDMFGGVPWSPGAGLQPGAGPRFFVSSVAQTLYLDGVFLLPAFFALFVRWLRTDDPSAPSPFRLVASYLGAVFFGALPLAALMAMGTYAAAYVLRLIGIGATVAHVGGYLIGMPTVFALLWLSVLREGGPVQSLLCRAFGQREIAIRESRERASA